MRVSPVGFPFHSEADVWLNAKLEAQISHTPPEEIRGAQATAFAIFMVKSASGKNQIRERVSQRFGYDLNRTVDDIRPEYAFDVSCQGTVPEAIVAFLESDSYEDAIRNAISLGGDGRYLYRTGLQR